MSDHLPIAILCGGRGTRANQPINKCFVPIHGKPFLLHIMEHLEFQGFTTFVLCRGTSGTLTALRDARHQLGERFIVCYGDTLLMDFDYRKFIEAWYESDKPVITASIGGIDAGVSGYTTRMLDMVDDDETSLVALQKELATCRLTHFYDPHTFWVEVGSEESIQHAKLMMS